MSLTNCYATLDQLRSEITSLTDVDSDDQLERALNAASRQIDAHCGRRFWQDATVKVRTFHADDALTCEVDDISTTTGLIVKADTGGDGTYASTLTITTHFVLEPLNAAAETPVRPYTSIPIVDGTGGYFPLAKRPGVQVTAKFGWPAVPDDVLEACCRQAYALFKGGDAALGILQTADGMPYRVGGLHPHARDLLEPYVRRY